MKPLTTDNKPTTLHDIRDEATAWAARLAIEEAKSVKIKNIMDKIREKEAMFFNAQGRK